MIDINTETLIHIKDVPKQLPSFRGKRVHIATIYRWMSRGVRGVRLEAVRIGGRVYTSKEALQRFAQQKHEPQPADPAAWRASLPKWRQRQIEAAEREVDAILNPKKKRNGKPK